MYRDNTIASILMEIKNEMKEEEGEDFSIEELYSITNSQFVAGGLAINKRLSVFYSYIGTFVLKSKKAYIKSIKDVLSLKDKVSEEEYNAIVKEKRIANKDTLNPSNLKLITKLEDLPEDVSERTILASYNKIYKQILNNEPIDNE